MKHEKSTASLDNNVRAAALSGHPIPIVDTNHSHTGVSPDLSLADFLVNESSPISDIDRKLEVLESALEDLFGASHDNFSSSGNIWD